LSIVYRQIDELKPNPANPRHHSKKQIQQIAASIDAFGFNVSILMIARAT
jgi:ParB-like chromosome segregation protein Spo0J